MAQGKAPNRVQRNVGFVDPRSGLLTEAAFHHLDQMWRQVAAGYVVVPCTATGKNAVTIVPTLHKEGAATLANYMPFAFVAEQTSDGSMTMRMTADGSFFKAYKDSGATQAGSGDAVAGSLYVAYWNSALDAGAGGWVLK